MKQQTAVQVGITFAALFAYNPIHMFEKQGHQLFDFTNQMAPAAGRLLVANPFMPDGSFKRAVILITEHNEEGTVGFILNRGMDLQLSDVLDVPNIEAFKLSNGGPVSMDTLHFVHRTPDIFPGSDEITSDVYWGGSFDLLKLHLENNRLVPEEVTFFVGYSGWSPEQLEHEIKEESWVVCPGNAELVFETNADSLWRKALLLMGDTYKAVSNFPKDPRLN